MTKNFKGLNNVSDPLRLGLAWLAQADNVDITNTGAISKRTGYVKTLSGATTSAYSTLDFARCFVVDGGTLKALTGPAAAVPLLEGVGTAPMHFTEINEQVFFNNGANDGIIQPDNTVLPWRATMLQDIEFLNVAGGGVDPLFDPLPLGADVIEHWRGQMYAVQFFPSENQSVVWVSQPLGYHLFNLDSDFFMVPGRVTMLAPHTDAMIIGTGSRIYTYDGTKISQISDYGVVPGKHWARDDDRLLFWSVRGLCAALPFSNLTERQISVAPGAKAGGVLVRSGGQKRYLAVLQRGGSPFNSLK